MRTFFEIPLLLLTISFSPFPLVRVFQKEGGFQMEEEDAYLQEHMPPPMQKKRDLETLAKKKNEQKKRRIRMAFAAKNVKTAVEDIPATGPGPWKVFMLINVHANETTKKQVEIRLHTYPHLVANVKNRLDQGAWVIVAMLGDFYLFDGFSFFPLCVCVCVVFPFQ